MKISELAKKIKTPSKMLLVQAVKLGIKAKSAQHILTGEQLDKIIKMLVKKKPSLDLTAIKKEAAEATKKLAKATTKKTAAKTKSKESDASKKKDTTTKAKGKTVKKATKRVTKKTQPSKVKEKTEEEVIAPEQADKRLPEKESIDKGTSVQAPSTEEVDSPKIANKKKLIVKLPIMVKEIAAKMSVGASLAIKELMNIGVFATINQLIDEDSAKEIADKFGFDIERMPTTEEETMAIHEEEESKEEDLMPRPPVVTFMGHVDHGKTSLLDYIREAKVTDQEKGGITQHIGAYEVLLEKGGITFLDTPGHEAFTAMRARGANATDIVVLVVAADDGIMPTTTEALDHARAANVPVIVAINKIDRPNIDIDKVKKQLSEVDLASEDWGGKTITVNVSAKTGEGVDTLLDMILLEAEMLELKANPKKSARGIVVEGRLSKGGGPIATVLVQNGTLCEGDIVITGKHYGKIRAIINDRIHRVKEALPAVPVEILGLNGVPQAGDTFMAVSDEKKAKEICESRDQRLKEEGNAPVAKRISLEDLYSEMQKGQIQELKVILKADVRGSLEALTDSLLNLSTNNMTLNVIHKGVGEINESDILLAAASNAIVIGFHIRSTPEAERASKVEHVDLRLYNIIYEAVSDIRAAMEGLLEPHIKETVVAKVSIKQVFKLSKSGIIAGSHVQKGKVTRNADCRLMRDGQEIYKGRISSLKRFKDDVKEVAEGFECGIALENFKTMKSGDIIEVIATEKIARKL
ncbi:translation initiation factor IF-2 [Candidatus Omnitrophota bacterium]